MGTSKTEKRMVALKNDKGLVREVKVGFSWTVCFFGGVPFLFRGIPLYAIALLLPWAGGGAAGGGFILGLVVDLVVAFHANKWTAVHLIEHGYKPIGDGWDFASKEWSLELDALR